MTKDSSRRRADREFDSCMDQGMGTYESLHAAYAVYQQAEREREQMEACHCRVRAHLAEGRARIEVDKLIRECQDQARQS